MNNKKKLDNETSESIDGSLRTKNFVEIYNKNETKLTNIPYPIFFRLQNMSKLLDYQFNGILLIKVIKESKRKKQKNYKNFKNHFFLNSFSVDQIDVFSDEKRKYYKNNTQAITL